MYNSNLIFGAAEFCGDRTTCDDCPLNSLCRIINKCSSMQETLSTLLDNDNPIKYAEEIANEMNYVDRKMKMIC